jgi:hypothetical protein
MLTVVQENRRPDHGARIVLSENTQSACNGISGLHHSLLLHCWILVVFCPACPSTRPQEQAYIPERERPAPTPGLLLQVKNNSSILSNRIADELCAFTILLGDVVVLYK